MFTGDASKALRQLQAQNQKLKVPPIKHAMESREISLQSSASLSEDQSLKNLRYGALSSSSAYSASAIFVNDNEDLLTEILLRLPPKLLLRFQIVSKRWLSIISSPSFRRLHCRRYPTTSSYAPIALFLCREIKEVRKLNFISFRTEDAKSMGTLTSRLTNFLSGRLWGFHSCNGLCIIFHSNHGHREIVVYNPTTHQYRLIPPVDILGSRENPKPPYYLGRLKDDLTLNIVFDPSKSDHYKIVCVRAYNYGFKDEYVFCLYASEAGLWREIKGKAESFSPLCFENGVFWNGNLHWFTYEKSLLCLDLENECLKWTGLPTATEEHMGFWYFGESGGHLYTIEANGSQPVLFDVYELEKNYSQWVLKYSIDLAPLATLYPSMVSDRNSRYRISMPNFLVDEKDNKSRLLISAMGKLISYDIHRATVRELSIESVDAYCTWGSLSQFNWIDAYPHFETFACV